MPSSLSSAPAGSTRQRPPPGGTEYGETERAATGVARPVTTGVVCGQRRLRRVFSPSSGVRPKFGEQLLHAGPTPSAFLSPFTSQNASCCRVVRGRTPRRAPPPGPPQPTRRKCPPPGPAPGVVGAGRRSGEAGGGARAGAGGGGRTPRVRMRGRGPAGLPWGLVPRAPEGECAPRVASAGSGLQTGSAAFVLGPPPGPPSRTRPSRASEADILSAEYVSESLKGRDRLFPVGILGLFFWLQFFLPLLQKSHCRGSLIPDFSPLVPLGLPNTLATCPPGVF